MVYELKGNSLLWGQRKQNPWKVQRMEIRVEIRLPLFVMGTSGFCGDRRNRTHEGLRVEIRVLPAFLCFPWPTVPRSAAVEGMDLALSSPLLQEFILLLLVRTDAWENISKGEERKEAGIHSPLVAPVGFSVLPSDPQLRLQLLWGGLCHCTQMTAFSFLYSSPLHHYKSAP